jgi:hypothetical protein
MAPKSHASRARLTPRRSPRLSLRSDLGVAHILNSAAALGKYDAAQEKN